MNLHLAPTLWAAVLLGAAASGWVGFQLIAPRAPRLEALSRRLQGRVPAVKTVLRGSAGPALLGVVLVLLGWWACSRPLDALLTLACGSVVYLLSRRFPAWRRERLASDRRRRCQEAFPQALEMTVQTLQVGQTLPQAIQYLAKESPVPLRDEFASLAAEMALGASTEEALVKFARSMDHPDANRFLEAYRLSRRSGANLVHLYRTQLEGIEERHRLLRRLDSMTAQARLSGLLMGLLPVFLLVILFVMDPDLLRPLVELPAGWAVLALAVFLEAIGFFWIRRLLKVDLG